MKGITGVLHDTYLRNPIICPLAPPLTPWVFGGALHPLTYRSDPPLSAPLELRHSHFSSYTRIDGSTAARLHWCPVVNALLALTFGCGVFIALAHVLNKKFIAPVYDVAANFIAFCSATASSILMKAWLSAFFAGLAVCCWIYLGIRTARYRARRGQATGVQG